MTTVDPANTAGQPALKRVIGRGMLLCFVVGDILGAGIYALVGKVAGHVGGCSGCRFCWLSHSPH